MKPLAIGRCRRVMSTMIPLAITALKNAWDSAMRSMKPVVIAALNNAWVNAIGSTKPVAIYALSKAWDSTLGRCYWWIEEIAIVAVLIFRCDRNRGICFRLSFSNNRACSGCCKIVSARMSYAMWSVLTWLANGSARVKRAVST